jgi:2-polyprenyl-6-methoxyphenol hydroxylase-like FAD-dependent oxidoreductase
MAVEDAASVAQLLPEGTTAAEVPDRLKLYERVRHERASWVQQQTRDNALDEDKRPAGKCLRIVRQV